MAPAAPAEMQGGQLSSSVSVPPTPLTPSLPAPSKEHTPLAPAASAEMQGGELSNSVPAPSPCPMPVALAAHAEMQRGEPSGSSCGAASSEVNANPPAWALPSLRQGQASTGVVMAPPLEQPVPATSDDANLASLRATPPLAMASALAVDFASLPLKHFSRIS